MGHPGSPAHLCTWSTRVSPENWLLVLVLAAPLPQSHRGSVRMGFVRSEKMPRGPGECLSSCGWLMPHIAEYVALHAKKDKSLKRYCFAILQVKRDNFKTAGF